MRRVIAVDTRGHGQSPRGTAPFTIQQFAEDLEAFMESHGIACADLLGFSDGGNIALVFTLRFPGPSLSLEELRTISQPVLVITGTHDMVKDKHSQWIASSLPHGKWVQIEGNHFIAEKNPAPFNRAVERFLAQTGFGRSESDSC